MLSSSFLEDLSVEILRIYEEIERQTIEFQRAWGLKCLPGCGQCCESPNVQVTVLEFLPLAREINRRGEITYWLKNLEKMGLKRACVFYQLDPFLSGKGRCLFYPWRAATCRLFGFGTKRNKYGNLEPVTCRHLQKDFAQILASLNNNLPGPAAPNYDSFFIQLASLEVSLGINPLPINKAIARALEKYALSFQLQNRN